MKLLLSFIILISLASCATCPPSYDPIMTEEDQLLYLEDQINLLRSQQNPIFYD